MKKNNGSQGIYFLPNFLSTINIFFGFISLLAVFHGRYLLAALFIIIAAVIDAFDGIIARLTKTQSNFGAEFDSFADAISFGVAPSFLLYFWGFKPVFPPGPSILFSFVLLTAGILRLARFNILQRTQASKNFSSGLTVASVSLLLAAIVLNHPQPIGEKVYASLLAILVVILSFCMVSTIKYKNFLNFNFRQRIDIKSSLFIAIIICGLILYPEISLLSIFSLNVLSGPSAYAFTLFKKKEQKKLKQKEAETLE
jgi:CDP-diacylglycerol--serine O-phosphatidyltransferase